MTNKYADFISKQAKDNKFSMNETPLQEDIKELADLQSKLLKVRQVLSAAGSKLIQSATRSKLPKQSFNKVVGQLDRADIAVGRAMDVIEIVRKQN